MCSRKGFRAGAVMSRYLEERGQDGQQRQYHSPPIRLTKPTDVAPRISRLTFRDLRPQSMQA